MTQNKRRPAGTATSALIVAILAVIAATACSNDQPSPDTGGAASTVSADGAVPGAAAPTTEPQAGSGNSAASPAIMMAWYDAMKSDLRNITMQQEMHMANTSAYATTLAELGMTPSPGISIQMTMDGPMWSATATHEKLAPGAHSCTMSPVKALQCIGEPSLQR